MSLTSIRFDQYGTAAIIGPHAEDIFSRSTAMEQLIKMLAAEHRCERAANQVVGSVNCEISEHLLTAEI
jgi:hypothetical protein